MNTFQIIKTAHLNNYSDKDHQRAIGIGIKDGWRTIGDLHLSSQLHPICYWQAMEKENEQEPIVDPCRRNRAAGGNDHITRQIILAMHEGFSVADICLLVTVLRIGGSSSPRTVTNEVQKLLHHRCLQVLERRFWPRSFKVRRDRH